MWVVAAADGAVFAGEDDAMMAGGFVVDYEFISPARSGFVTMISGEAP